MVSRKINIIIKYIVSMNKVILILAILAILYVLGIQIIRLIFTEGYQNLSPALVDKGPLLNGSYPLKTPPGLNPNTTSLWKTYPTFKLGSYAQKTNNIRYWPTPNNGLCEPLTFCGSLYQPKKIHIPPRPVPIPLDSPDIRVNFYAAKTYED